MVTTNRALSGLLLCLGLFSLHRHALANSDRTELTYAPTRADNPLRGLVPYAGAWKREQFKHSVEFEYFPLDVLMRGLDDFTWGPLEEKLAETQIRGYQLNFRVWLEYPGKGDHLPDFLRSSVGVTAWMEGDVANYTPDYEAEDLIVALESFIAALGEKYNTDPRIGFIEAGLIGKWGEWHMYLRDDLMASTDVQERVMNAYKAAFPAKKILLRYPAGPGDSKIADNANEPFGYHDDSFGWSTLYVNSSTPGWYFGSLMRKAMATSKWETYPIGGEIYPGLFNTMFTPSYTGQDFVQCVEQTHLSFVRDSGMFSSDNPPDDARMAAATEAVEKMGYVLHVASAEKSPLPGGMVQLRLKLENRGVAPFYFDWPVILRAATENVDHTPVDWKLSEIMPGQPTEWVFELPDSDVYTLRVPNPMAGGKALRFANQEQVGDELVIAFSGSTEGDVPSAFPVAAP